jgi:hypothetical protein
VGLGALAAHVVATRAAAATFLAAAAAVIASHSAAATFLAATFLATFLAAFLTALAAFLFPFGHCRSLLSTLSTA